MNEQCAEITRSPLMEVGVCSYESGTQRSGAALIEITPQ